MSEEIDYAARVQRGIALMDVKWPNWATEIDLEKLDIASPRNCVTAQYAGFLGADRYYLDGMEALDLTRREYADLGFNGDEDKYGDIPNEAYERLNPLWKAEIERRRAQGQDAPAEPEATS
jgi:hypothetical protein